MCSCFSSSSSAARRWRRLVTRSLLEFQQSSPFMCFPIENIGQREYLYPSPSCHLHVLYFSLCLCLVVSAAVCVPAAPAAAASTAAAPTEAFPHLCCTHHRSVKLCLFVKVCLSLTVCYCLFRLCLKK